MQKLVALTFVALLALGALAVVPTTQAGPVITSVTSADGSTGGVASGSTNGGSLISINGAGFDTGAVVLVGGTPARAINVASATGLSFLTPPRATSGSVSIVITNPDQQFTTFNGGFTYTNAATPTLTSVSPQSGSQVGGTLVTITGTGFKPAATKPIVTMCNQVAATQCVFPAVRNVTATTITIFTPGAPFTAADLKVQNPDGKVTVTPSDPTANDFSFTSAATPTLSSLSVAQGTSNGGSTILLTGTNFAPGALVAFCTTVGPFFGTGACSTNPASSTSFLGSTSLSVITPALPDASSPQSFSVVVTNPDGRSTNGAVIYTFTHPSAPSVTSVSPDSGPTLGGGLATITGTHFHTGSNVKPTVVFGTTPVAPKDVVVTSDTTLQVRVPAQAGPGPQDIIVTNPNTQTDTLAGAFTYKGIVQIASITPSSALSTGRVSGATDPFGGSQTTVTLTGSGFTTGTLIAFDTMLGRVESVGGGGTSMVVTVPPHASGPVAIFLLNPDGSGATLSGAFTYGAVSAADLTAVSPGSVGTNGDTLVTATGTGFFTAINPNPSDPKSVAPQPVVTVGGLATHDVCTAADDVAAGGACDSTHIHFRTPIVATAANNKAVRIALPDGRVAASDSTNNGDDLDYADDPAPVVGSVSTATGSANGGTVVMLTAGDDTSGCNTPFPTQEDAVNPCILGGPFAVPSSSLAPKPVVIVGTLVVPAAQVFPVQPSGTALGQTCSASHTCIIFATPADPAAATTDSAALDIKVTNPDGRSGTKAAAFTYTHEIAPTVTGVDVGSGPTIGGTKLTLSGSHFGPITKDASNNGCAGSIDMTKLATPVPIVLLGGTGGAGLIACVTSATSMTVFTPAHSALGSVSIQVTDPDGLSGTAAQQFSYNSVASAPSLTSLSQPSAPSFGTTTISLFGSNFPVTATFGAAQPSKCGPGTGIQAPGVVIGGTSVPASDIVCVSSGEIRVKAPSHAVGPVAIVATNPDNQVASLGGALTYLPLAPFVTSTSGNSGPTIGGTVVTAPGLTYPTDPIIFLGGKLAQASTHTTTSLVFPAPAKADTSGGTVDLLVVSLDGQTATLKSAFTYITSQVPTYTALVPDSASANGGSTLVLFGSGLSPSATITVDGTSASGVQALTGGISFVAPNFMKGTTTNHPLGVVDIVMTNPDGRVLSLLQTASAGTALMSPRFAYTPDIAPTITGVTPTSGPASGGTAVTITGTGFASGATVTFGTTAATGVTVVSSTSITATSPAGSGAVSVSVTTGGQTVSLPSAFTYDSSTSSSSSSSTSTTNANTGTTTTTGTTTGTGVTPTITGTPPTSLTPTQILNANKKVKLTVTRDGNDNVLSWTLPTTGLPAAVQGVQIWRSNSPYTLVKTISSTDPAFSSHTFTDTGANAKATTKYLVTMYYGAASDLGFFTASTAPDTSQYAGTASTDQAAKSSTGGLPNWAIVLIVVGILFLVVLVAILIARGRNREGTQGAAAQGYAWQETNEQKAAEGEWQPPAEVHQARCPSCGTSFTATGSKPIVTVCPGCGKKGILR